MRYLFIVLAGLLTASGAEASALYKMNVKFASMTKKEIVVRNRLGKRIWLKRDLIKKSEQNLLEKKSQGKFVTVAVLSSAVIKKEK
jgi:hypothetical protein